MPSITFIAPRRRQSRPGGEALFNETDRADAERAQPYKMIAEHPEFDTRQVEGEPLTVINETAYKPHKGSQRFFVTVEAIIDPTPGAWHQPEDLMHWIATHSYVQKVTLVPKD